MKKRVINLLLVLPEEIIIQITSGLDLKSMIMCMLVCKQWRNLIYNNPLVGKGHVQFLVYSTSTSLRFGDLDEETKEIAWMKTLHLPKLPCIERVTSSCNGLVWFRERYSKDIYICNPIIGENISFPKLGCTGFTPQYDLGFCPSSNEYKLTLFGLDSLGIYTLGNPAGWRNVPFEYPQLRSHEEAERPLQAAVCVGGVFHWLHNSQSILTFDLAEEVFGSIHLPRLEDDKEIYGLGCMDHCLVVTAGFINPLKGGLEIWTGKKDRSSIWIKNWVIDAAQSLEQNFI